MLWHKWPWWTSSCNSTICPGQLRWQLPFWPDSSKTSEMIKMSMAWSKQIWLSSQLLCMRKIPTNSTCLKTKTSFGFWPNSAALKKTKKRRQRAAVCISCSNASSAWSTSLVRSRRISSYFASGFVFTEILILRCLLWLLSIHCLNFLTMLATPRSCEDCSQI